MGTEAVTPESVQAPAAKRTLVKAHVQELIAAGVLRRGSRCPSILDLSRDLDVAKNTVVAALDELGRRARIAGHQSEAFAGLGRFASLYTGGLFWRFDFAEAIDAMALYRAARERNVLVSPGNFFRTDDEPDDGVRDAWRRLNA